MKQSIRIVSLLLIFAMLFSTVAFAEEVDKGSELGNYTITGYNGATVSFVAVDGNDQIKVTYTDAEGEDAIVPGAYYLVLMIKGDGSADSITAGNIQYIDQTVGADDHSITFYVYPEKLAAGTILITGSGLSASTIPAEEGETAETAVGLIAAIVRGKYLLGDVDGDGYITASDAALILRALVGNATLTDEQMECAKFDADGDVTASDAAAILRYLVSGT